MSAVAPSFLLLLVVAVAPPSVSALVSFSESGRDSAESGRDSDGLGAAYELEVDMLLSRQGDSIALRDAAGESVLDEATDENEVVFKVALKPWPAPLHTVRVLLRDDWAPLACNQFRKLVTQRWFDNSAMFRVIPNFIAQFGIPASKRLQPKTIEDEERRSSNKRGTIVFANTGPNTRSGQVFINTVDNEFLDTRGFVPFGYITEGMDVVEKFNSEYAEKPDQMKIQLNGNFYLNRNFPRLTKIRTARFAPQEPSSPSPEGDANSAGPGWETADAKESVDSHKTEAELEAELDGVLKESEEAELEKSVMATDREEAEKEGQQPIMMTAVENSGIGANVIDSEASKSDDDLNLELDRELSNMGWN